MAASNFNLRSIPPEVMSLLKRQAKEQNISVNLLILKLVEQGVGFTHRTAKVRFHDLDNLAGTWSEADSKAFHKYTEPFEKIDKELWS